MKLPKTIAVFYVVIATILLVTSCKRGDDNYLILKPIPANDSISAVFSGLTGGFYGSTGFKRFLMASPENEINLKWDATSSNGTSWSAQWEGYLISPVTGTVTLKASTNKNAIISLGGTELINLSDPGKPDSASVRLRKNRIYPINIRYIQLSSGDESAGGATYLQLLWKYGRKEMTIIPSSALWHTVDQEKNWMYLGENYMAPYNPADTSGYLLDPIRIIAPELFSLDFKLPTGGLPVVDRIKTYTVCRANRENPSKAEGLGYTFQHHQDIAVWHGRIYVGWNTCKVDEDTWPSREVYSTSLNGKEWTRPAEMFPQGVSTPLRMYFYLSPKGRMLMIAGLRTSLEVLSERNKYGLVVREIYPDHSLGKVYTLRKSKEEIQNIPDFYLSSKDIGFVNACLDLLNDNLYLSQQDYGNLLEPEQKMEWFDPGKWIGGDNLKELASEFGKALCFYKRRDGAIVGVCKRRWVTVSHDNGKTWSQPVLPKSLVTWNGKVWGQETSRGRYVLIYNPDRNNRWPLVILSGNDGITFRNPRSISDELPEKRYEGKAKNIGLSYHRGLSHWNNDGTIKDDGIWIVYSVNKEDIVISRIPADI